MSVAVIRGGTAKYRAMFALAARQVLAARGEAVTRGVFLVVLLLILSRLWKAVAADGGTGMFTVTSLIWYLAITEWITLSAPATYLKIEEDVRRGDIAYSLTRPASYLSVRLAEGAGEMFVRLIWLAVVGFFAAYFMSGGLPADPRGLLLAIPVGLLASVLTLLFQVGIGLSAFWIQEAAPVF